MIIGNGMMAKAMQKIDNDKLLIFVSGVSNSMETNKKSYQREYNLLQNTLVKYPNKKLIYFSTSSIYDSSKKEDVYIRFKLEIEKFIRENVANYLIFRAGNVVGKSNNPNTLINFLQNAIANEIKFPLFTNAKRMLIDIDDVVKFIDLYKTELQNKIVDLHYPYQYPILQIVKAIENQLGKKGNYKLENIGQSYELKDSPMLNDFFKKNSPDMYLQKMINKLKIKNESIHNSTYL